MLELYQTEWCPASRRVRERLTELSLDYLVHQVPRRARTANRVARGDRRRQHPDLAARGRHRRRGRGSDRRLLDERFDPPGAEAHRLKAAKARRRYLEEECECLQPATR
jgi:glutaredoxin